MSSIEKYEDWEKRKVFLDTDTLTWWDNGIIQRFHRAEKIPIYGLEPGPAGSWDCCYTTVWGSVLIENGVYRIWYWGQGEAEKDSDMLDRPHVCYAESEDGIHWKKPDLKITGQHKYPGNNLLALPGAAMSVVPAIPGTGVDAKYLMALIQYDWPLEPDVTDVPGNERDSGTFIYASDDGLHWRKITKLFCHGDWACLYFDPASKKYLLYNKTGAVSGLCPRRIGIGLESKDGVHWEGYDGVRRWHECFVPDDYDDEIAQRMGFLIAEYYGVGVYRAGEILISIEDIFTVSNPLRQMMAQNPAGLCHFRLGFSHDGLIWRHPKGRPVWLALGNPGEPDAGFMTPSNTFVESGEDLLFYYGGSRYDHGWILNPDFSARKDVPRTDERDSCRVMMAKIKRDRFASLAATYKGMFDVEAGPRKGNALFINASCPNGSIRVAIAEKEPYHGALRKSDNLPGFSFDDCVPFVGDKIKAQVMFKNASISQIPENKHLTIRFEVRKGEVFAYEWGG
jgi:hypothetical protein